MAALSDTASGDEAGKLTIVGIFDTIWARALPARHAHMALSIRVRYDYDDSGREIPMVIVLEDEDGNKSLQLEGSVDAKVIKPGEFLFANHVVAFGDLVFLREGKYLFHATIAGRRIDLPFWVKVRDQDDG